MRLPPFRGSAWPPGLSTINLDSPDAVGLVAAFLDGKRDLVNGYVLEPRNGATTEASQLGGPVARANAGNAGHGITTPAPLKLTLPISMACWVEWTGTPTDNAGVFGVNWDQVGTSPYLCFALNVGTAPKYVKVEGNSGGTYYKVDSTVLAATDVRAHIVAVITSAGVVIYANGVVNTTSSGAKSNPTHNSSSTVYTGEGYTNQSRNSATRVWDARLYSRELSATDIARIYAPETRWDVYAQR